MSLTPAIFKTKYPEFAGEADPLITRFIEEAKLFLNQKIYKKKYDLALELLTAHEITLFNDKADANSSPNTPSQPTSRAIQGGSISYNITASTNEESYYQTTYYGQRFLKIQQHPKKVFYNI